MIKTESRDGQCHFLSETPIDHRDNNVEKIERRRSQLDFVVKLCLELQDPTGGRTYCTETFSSQDDVQKKTACHTIDFRVFGSVVRFFA